MRPDLRHGVGESTARPQLDQEYLELLVRIKLLEKPGVSDEFFEDVKREVEAVAADHAERGRAEPAALLYDLLGSLVFERYSLTRPSALDESIRLYQKSIATLGHYKKVYETIRRQLGLAQVWQFRSSGDRSANLNWAMVLLINASSLWKANAETLGPSAETNSYVARIKAGILTSYVAVRKHQPIRNIPDDVSVLEEALAAIKPHGGDLVAAIYALLAEAHKELAQQGGGPIHYAKAMEAVQAGLRIEELPPRTGFALRQLLGDVYRNRPSRNRARNVRRAIEQFEIASRLPGVEESDRAKAAYGAALCYLDLSRKNGDRFHQLAIGKLFSAQALLEDTEPEPDTLKIFSRLAAELYAMGSHGEAHGVALRTESILKELASEGASFETHKFHLRSRELYDLLACTFLSQGDIRASLDAALHAKRTVLASASRRESSLAARITGGFHSSDLMFRALKRAWQKLDQEMVAAVRDFALGGDPNEESIVQARMEVEKRWLEYLHHAQPLGRVAIEAGCRSTAPGVELSSGVVLVHYHLHQFGGGAYIQVGDRVLFMELPGVLDVSFESVAARPNSRDTDFSVTGQGPRQVSETDLENLFRIVLEPIFTVLDDDSSGDASDNKLTTVILIPDGPIHEVPLQGCLDWIKQREEIPYDVRQVPSTHTLSVLNKRPPNRRRGIGLKRRRLLSIGYDAFGNREKIEVEAKNVAEVFPRSTLITGERTTVSRLAREAKGKDYIHIACHGDRVKEHPMLHSLLLPDGILTVQRILTQMDLRGTRLVTLAACTTGWHGEGSLSDVVGLPQAFLNAGAEAVISCMWDLDDEASHVYFSTLYRFLATSDSIQGAMRVANEAVRGSGESGWNNPYFWAGITLHGITAQV